MKFLSQTCIATCIALLATSLLMTTVLQAEESVVEAREIEQPDISVPAVIEFSNDTPTNAKLSEPDGVYKDLADTIVTRLQRDNRHEQYIARVYHADGLNDGRQKARLLIINRNIDPMVVSFKSNCSVNSQFDVSVSVASAAAATNTEQPWSTFYDPDDQRQMQDYWLSDVCAKWTIHNHRWLKLRSCTPRTYKAQRYRSRERVTIDISYNHDEVNAYNDALVRLEKQNSLQLVKR